ncbi:glycosyltransferase family 39 protein [Streptomyces gobiensis]|uniref:glycosyltransferase family 39 protein n=1 Tax=Streptomyces gobiensis TaxID=2875706 RepID=UPI001E414E7B|nr:glycosyltransferase family 39 protein [Streptomyces gobiensis]UGY91997.1 glycosyltransferase family 39 protein [Streptomyces gobiensis]
MRRWAFTAAVVLTAAAVLQQVMLAVGLGGWLPGWQPWPYLLVAAPLWLYARPVWPRWDWRLPGWLLRVPVWAYVLGVLALTALLWAALQDHEPYMGHEEAVYANKARSWLDGTPDAGWGVYRPLGLSALGCLALAIHNDVGALRAVALILALFTLTVTYLTAARWTTPRRAVVVLLLLLSGLGFLRRMPEFLNDIGSTGLLLIAVYLLTRAQEAQGREGSRALLALPFVVLAAFYLRYGVVGNLVAIALAALIVYGPRAWAAHGRHLVIGLGVLLLGLIPHFVYATRVADWPLGLVFSATSQANRAFIGDGFLYYLAIFPYRLAGDLGAVVMTAGLVASVAAVRRLRRGSPRTNDRRQLFLTTSAILIFIVLGFATDGEPRFVYLPVILLMVLGVQALADWAGNWSARLLTAVAALAAVTVFGTAQSVAHGAMPGPTHQHASTLPVARSLTNNGPCLLVTGYEPEIGWYSGCDAVTYQQYRRMTPPPDTKVSLILFERGRLQPGPAALQRLVGNRDTETRTVPTKGSLGTATVITLV